MTLGAEQELLRRTMENRHGRAIRRCRAQRQGVDCRRCTCSNDIVRRIQLIIIPTTSMLTYFSEPAHETKDIADKVLDRVWFIYKRYVPPRILSEVQLRVSDLYLRVSTSK